MSQDTTVKVSTHSVDQCTDREQAKDFFDRGQWNEALSSARAVLGYNPSDQEMQLLVGDALYHLGSIDEAAQHLREFIKLRPDVLIAFHKLAVVLARGGQISEADQQYEYLFEKEPSFNCQNLYDFSVQRQSGDFFFRQQNWSRAVDSYRQAITIEPYACWEHINLGRSLSNLHHKSEAINILKKAVGIDQNSAWANYYLAELLSEKGELEKAVEHCQTACLLMPNHPESKNLLAKLNSQQRKLAQLNRNQSDEKNSATEITHKSSKEPKSINLKQIDVISGWRDNYELGKRLQIQGELEQASKAYYQSIIKNPYYSWSYHDLGDVNLKLGNWDEAIAAYQQAIRLNPDYFWTNYNLGVAYRKTHAWEKTVDLYLCAAKLHPGHNLPLRALEETLIQWYETLMQEGDACLQSKPNDALSLYRQAIHVYKNNTYIPEFTLSRELKEPYHVLLIVDAHLDQCLRYRVEQKIEQLEDAGFNATYYSWTNLDVVKNKISFFDIIIFYRTPAFPNIIRLIQYAKKIKKIVFYEIDDLIFDPDLFPEPIESYGGQVTQNQYDGLVRGTILFQEAMKLFDLAIASTPPLQKQMEKYVGEGNCFLHRNGLDSNIDAAIKFGTPKLKRDYISIFYGSGTKAHNSDFDELVAPALANILKKYSHVRLTLMGYLTIPEVLEPYSSQIDRVDLVKDILVYYEFLKQADISIAVLHPTIVNNCKSELKWFEAASFKIPCVVSNTDVYHDVVEHGSTGFIASTPQEWFSCLESLIRNQELRQRVGSNAYNLVMNEYSVSAMGKNIRNILEAGVEKSMRSGAVVAKPPRKKLLIVNVFYPPQSIGGATRIVKDNVDVLISNYSDQYEISVFTTDEDNPEPYQILEYTWEGVHVTKVSSPMIEGMDWQYRNPKMYDIFQAYLETHTPDLIHFHCIQRLTASVLEVAADLEIPYVVTAHDAWWISDYQFLVNEHGQECNYQQNDPVIVACDTRNLTDSMQRKLYLRTQLNRAAGVLAVSEAFAELYRQNGFTQTQANRNGIQPTAWLPRVPSESGKVRLAHIGGMAAHKGYFLFKEAVETSALSNIEVIVVNHAQSPGTIEYGDWNGTPVTFLSKFKQEDIKKLYSTIDVLVAPSMWPESFGLVTREAVAAGVWVVTSNKGAIGEDVSQGIDGYICSVEDTTSLIEILNEIDNHPSKYRNSPQNNSKIRTTQEQVLELINIYHKIA